MKKTENTKKKGVLMPWVPWLITLGILLLLALTMVYVYETDDYYKYNMPLTTDGIPSARPAQTAARRTGSELIPQARIWLDVCPNMVGFINGRKGSVESTYKQLLASLKITLARNLDWYWFNNISVGTMTEIGFQDTSKYTDAAVSLSKAHGIGMVLQNARVDAESPLIIFTDLESIYREEDIYDSLQALQALLQAQVFEQGLCLRIDRFVSAYSGLLEIYGVSPHYVYYGENDDFTPGIPIIETNAMYYHPQPRSFYVLTIGTASQCEAIGTCITTTYNIYCADLQAPFDDPKMNLGSYKEHDTYRFYRHSPTQVGKLECISALPRRAGDTAPVSRAQHDSPARLPKRRRGWAAACSSPHKRGLPRGEKCGTLSLATIYSASARFSVSDRATTRPVSSRRRDAPWAYHPAWRSATILTIP